MSTQKTEQQNTYKCSFCRKERTKKEIVGYIHLYFDKNKLCNGYEIAVLPEYLHDKVNFVCCKYCLKSFFDLFNIGIEANMTLF